MKTIDLFLGIKAEQTLRDVAREAAEASLDEEIALDLCPVGKKDWIAGKRLGPSISFGEIEKKRQAIVVELIALKSHQRIRQENLRLFAVHPPVPVFKESSTLEEAVGEQPSEAEKDSDTAVCPVCGTEVNRYNLQYNANEQVVGCYLCRGELRHD